MPQFSRSLDVYQGYNFKKDKQSSIGYVTSLKIGDVVFKADQETIRDPENPDTVLKDKVVAPINHFLWETGTTDAQYLSFQVSVENKQVIAAKLLTDFTNTEVVLKYVVYEYDPSKKKYFKSCYTDEPLKGLLEKNGDSLNLSVADEESHEVQSPKNFTLQIGVKPQPTEQTINMATGSGKNLVKKWGVTESA